MTRGPGIVLILVRPNPGPLIQENDSMNQENAYHPRPRAADAIDYTIIHAYERGLDDGFFQGERNDTYLGPRDELRVAYERGYDHGVWMYCEREAAS